MKILRFFLEFKIEIRELLDVCVTFHTQHCVIVIDSLIMTVLFSALNSAYGHLQSVSRLPEKQLIPDNTEGRLNKQ